MNRHLAFTALALAGVLMLTACGSAAPAGNGGVRVGNVIHVGPYTQVFAGQVPAGSAQASVIEAFREGQVLWEKSENAGRLAPLVRDYVTGQALTHLAAAMKANNSSGLVPAGLDRFFMTRVTRLSARTATVATCDDGSKYKEVNPHTGKVDASFLPTPGQQYLFETWQMGRVRGHWAIAGLSVEPLPNRSAEPCQPGMTGPGPAHLPAVAALLGQMKVAVGAARSVHIAGTTQQYGTTLTVNLSLSRSGEIYGQVSTRGQAVTVLAVAGHVYLRISAAYLRTAHLPASACHRYCGRYLAYPAAQSRQIVSQLSMASITRSMASTRPGNVTLLGAVRVNGRPAWLMQDHQENSIYVAANGTPYVIRGVSAPPGDITVSFTDWNTARLPGPPPANLIVTPAALAAAQTA